MPVQIRTLCVQPDPDVKVTKRILHRRAMELATVFGCGKVQVMEGSKPQNLPWRFTFVRGDVSGNESRVLVLNVTGTRGQVYTALGNYLHGAEGMYQLLENAGKS